MCSQRKENTKIVFNDSLNQEIIFNEESEKEISKGEYRGMEGVKPIT